MQSDAPGGVEEVVQWHANSLMHAVAEATEFSSAKLVGPDVILTSVMSDKEVYVMPRCPTCSQFQECTQGLCSAPEFFGTGFSCSVVRGTGQCKLPSSCSKCLACSHAPTAMTLALEGSHKPGGCAMILADASKESRKACQN